MQNNSGTKERSNCPEDPGSHYFPMSEYAWTAGEFHNFDHQKVQEVADQNNMF